MVDKHRRIVVVDYGLGNLFSIKKALHRLSEQAIFSSEAQSIADADYVILPGVGAFADGMANLRQLGLDQAVKNYVSQNRPFLGICLGMQLLFDGSEEHGKHAGLGILQGNVVNLRSCGCSEKVPHVGWNALSEPSSGVWRSSPLAAVPQGSYVYFTHSYCAVPVDPSVILAETAYGQTTFCSAVRYGRMIACQFHPEMSGETGLRILSKFLFDQ